MVIFFWSEIRELYCKISKCPLGGVGILFYQKVAVVSTLWTDCSQSTKKTLGPVLSSTRIHIGGTYNFTANKVTQCNAFESCGKHSFILFTLFVNYSIKFIHLTELVKASSLYYSSEHAVRVALASCSMTFTTSFSSSLLFFTDSFCCVPRLKQVSHSS